MTYGKFLFAIGIIASGVLMFVNGGFYSPWVPVTKWIPGHVVLGYASAAILTIGGVGLLVKATAERSARVLFWFLLAFLIVMKTPPALAEANVEVHWLDEGQIAVLVAGALTLAASKQRQLLAARYLCGAALIPIGLSHFFYWKISMTMVPSVLPYPKAWVMFTGTAHIAAGLGLLTGVRAWLAATPDARVDRLVTIATPHAGTRIARHARGANAAQMREGSDWLRGLARTRERAARASVLCFWSRCDNIVFPTRNATLEGADNREIAGAPHVAMVFHPAVLEEVLRLVSVRA